MTIIGVFWLGSDGGGDVDVLDGAPGWLLRAIWCMVTLAGSWVVVMSRGVLSEAGCEVIILGWVKVVVEVNLIWPSPLDNMIFGALDCDATTDGVAFGVKVVTLAGLEPLMS